LNAAATAAGWSYKSVAYSSTNSATLVAGMQQALQYHPAAVALFGVPYSAWSSVVPAYKAAHVAIITGFDPGVPVTSLTSGQIQPNFYGQADRIADYVVAKSNGKAHVLVFDIPAYPVDLAATKRFQSDLDSLCPGCTTTPLNVSIDQVTAGQTESAIVSALQKDTNVNYVEICNGGFTPGFPSALAAADLSSRVKVVGMVATTQDSAAIKAGTELAYTPLGHSMYSWLMVDAALRFAEGMPVPTSAYVKFGAPTMLIDSATVNKMSAANVNDFQIPANYQQQFLKLWKVS
jgi:ribose transport system substrate-binding protein